MLAVLLLFSSVGCKNSEGDDSDVEVIYEYEYITQNGNETDDEADLNFSKNNTTQSQNSTESSSQNDTDSQTQNDASDDKDNSSKEEKESSVEEQTDDSVPTNLTAEEKEDYIPKSITVTLYDVKANSYGITWNSLNKPYEPVVQVCEGNKFSTKKAKEYSVAVEKQSTYNTNDTEYVYYISKAVIKLEPDKIYTYRAFDKKLKLGSETAILKPKNSNTNKFTFIHIADSQVITSPVSDPTSSGYELGETLRAMRNGGTEFSFLLHTGDIVEWSKYESYWEKMLHFNSKYLMTTPFMPISGNHETLYKNGSNEVFKHFNLKFPSQPDTKLGFYYSFNYGNAKFIMLNTNRLTSNQLTKDQYNWLVSELKKNTKKWTIVAMHNPLYSIGSWGSNPERNYVALALRKQLSGIFAQYGVDLVLQGHDHAYSKTFPITSSGDVDKTHKTEIINGITYDVNPKGTIYVMHGVAGNQARGANSAMNPAFYDWYDHGQNNSWAEITVEDDMLTVNVKNGYNGKAFLRKSYGIKKK